MVYQVFEMVLFFSFLFRFFICGLKVKVVVKHAMTDFMVIVVKNVTAVIMQHVVLKRVNVSVRWGGKVDFQKKNHDILLFVFELSELKFNGTISFQVIIVIGHVTRELMAKVAKKSATV